MTSSISGTLNTRLRLTGLSSGLDTDTVIKQLMQIERMKVDKVKQNKQILEWKRDDYRSLITQLTTFTSSFLDYAKPATNMRSASLYTKYTATSSNSSAVTATGGAGITKMTHTINSITQLATASNAVSTGAVSKGTSTLSWAGRSLTEPIVINDYENAFKINYNGTTKTITLASGSYDLEALAAEIDSKVNAAFGNVHAQVNGTAIEFTYASQTDMLSILADLKSDNLLTTLGLSADGTGTDIDFPITIDKGRSFKLSIVENGITTTKEIEWSEAETYADSEELAAAMNSKIEAAFGGEPDKINVDGTGGKLTFVKGSGVSSVALSNTSKNDKVLDYIGFESLDSNKLSLSDTMLKVSEKLAAGAITFTDGKFTATINGVAIEVDQNDTLSKFLTKVNSSGANVTMSYSSHTDSFTITSKATGEGSITLSDTGNFFTNTKLTSIIAGQNAVFTLDSQTASRSDNTFTIDGVTYTLHSETATAVDIALSLDSDSIYNSIKDFVDKYNEMLSSINNKLSEERDRDYLPLTDEQREAMSESQIEQWEAKAKAGLLKNDSLLNNLVNSLRRALYEGIEGVSVKLSDIGITTGSYEKKGQLVIDEAKLKSAIQNTPDVVKSIFAQDSDVSYSRTLTSFQRQERYNESGIAHRLYDILQDYVSISRDSNGQKGLLLERAGIVGDTTEIKSTLVDAIKDKDDLIDTLLEKLYAKEEMYYKKFAAMEKALSQMNSQSAWLTQQFGSGQ